MKKETLNLERTKAMQYEPLLAAGVLWKDSTSYSRNADKDTIATAYATKIGDCKITITKGHIHYRPEWIFHCYELGFDTQQLPTGISTEMAAGLAIRMCKEKVARLHDAFNTCS